MKISNLKFKISNLAGQSLVELVLVMGLSVILLPALLTGFVASREGTAEQKQRGYGTALLKETEEAVKNVKNNSWTTFAVNGTYHAVVSGNQWTFVSGTNTDSNGLNQSIVISNINRDNSGAIVSSGGQIDPSTKKVVITISWTSPVVTSVSSTLYLTRTGNQIYTETTQTQFNLGINTGTVVVASAPNPTPTPGDGQIQLGAGGRGDWCAPNLNYPTVDLPKSGVANAITGIEGKVFAGTGNNSAGVSFAKVDITNPAYPASPSATVDKVFDGYKTNGVFGETSYAYLATDNKDKEVVIIDLTQTNPSDSTRYLESGHFDAPGNGNGNSVYIIGSVGYMIDGSDKLYTFDLSSHSGPRTQTGSYTLAATGNKVFVVGSYAYVANNSSTNQLEIVDISDPNNPVLKKRFSVSGAAGKDVFINASGTRAYLATASSSTLKELFVVDVSDKSNPVVKGSYEANGMSPKGVSAVTNNKVIMVGTGAEEYQVIDVATETSPVRCGGLNIDTGVNGLTGVLEGDGDAYSYIITGDASSELKIIAGGVGGSFSSAGTFESATYDAGSTIAFNRLAATIAQPVNSTIKMQVAASTAVSGSCASATFTYVGPNGNSSAYFTPNGSTISGTIPFGSYSPDYQNPAQCFRYKTWFDTTDSTQSPVLYDVILNRSL